jgi:hypothetical protein
MVAKRITAKFGSGLNVVIYIGRSGGEARVHAVVRDAYRSRVISKGEARRLGVPQVGILPQISPVSRNETILVPGYVRRSISSTLASLHFRNQLNLLCGEAFQEFKGIAEDTWPGLVIQELRGRGGEPGASLSSWYETKTSSPK